MATPPKTDNERVVVLCPGEVVSGGPEALHQLGATLCSLGVNAAICYFPFEKQFSTPPDQYRKYGVPVCIFDDIGDAAVVIPEARTGFSKLFRNDQVWIWWLSVDNYKNGKHQKDNTRYRTLNEIRCLRHLSQSAYASDFLLKNGISSYPLSDYLSHHHARAHSTENPRERIVLYNPKKGWETTKAIIARLPHEQFVPIDNMSPDLVVESLCRAALYIDFGQHPGKDRIPREAAMAGACVITGRRGAAGNSVDIPIPEKYKIDEQKTNFLDIACAMIVDTLDHFPKHSQAFEAYRNWISQEQDVFVQQTRHIFFRERDHFG